MKKIPILLKEIIDNHILMITLNNPSKRNPLSMKLIRLLQKEFNGLKKNKKIKVVIIQSTGASFSSGHDLKEIRSSSSTDLSRIFKECSKMMVSIRYLPQPVIASIDGLAAAAGCQLVASCDLAIATKNSFFQTPGVNIGLFCSTPMVAISRKILPKDMMKMLLTGDKIDATEAKKIGLINIAVLKKNLRKETIKLAKNISSKSHQSIIIGKEAFYKQLEMDIDKAYQYTSKVMTKNMQFRDAKEGINAFITKRRPTWNK